MKVLAVLATLCMVILVARPMAQGSHPTHPQHPTHPKPQKAPRPATPSQASHGKPATVGAAAHTPSSVPKNPKLVAKLQPLLPGGLSVEQAATGFSNQGQFIAAVHVSHNLEISFSDVKTKVLSDGGSLGSAIKALKPSADAKAEIKRANQQAADDLK
jgi:hypothetical protein